MNPRTSDLQRDGLRRALAGALADVWGGDPAEISTARWGHNRPAPMIEQRAGISGMISGGASPFRDESLAFFESVSADSLLSAMPLRKVPFGVRLVSVSTASTGSWVGESLAKPVSRMALSAAGLEPRKVSCVTVVSDELLKATEGEQAIQSDLKRAVSNALDLAFLSDDAASASVPAGILNGVSITSGGGDVQGSVGALLDDFAGDTRRAVFIARASVYASVSSDFPRVGLRNGFLLNAPALVSPYAPADTLILADAGMIALAGGIVEVSASKNASIEMDSAPVGRAYEGDSPEGANLVNMVSMFQTNCTALRAEIFVNWAAQSRAVSAMDVSSWAGVSP